MAVHLWIRFAVVAACVATITVQASARDLFEMRVTIDNMYTQTVGTNEFKEIDSFFDEQTLDELFAGIVDFDPLVNAFSGQIDLRGLPAELSWDPAGGGTLSLTIPGVIPPGLLTFSGGTLEEDLDNLEDWFTGDFESATAPEALVTKLLQAIVANSPVDPVAGNPNSLMSRMTGHDFMLGSEGPFIHSDERIPSAPDQTGIGLVYGRSDGDGFDVDTLELPFDHRFNLRGVPNLSILLSIPVTATFTNSGLSTDGWSVMASLGVGAQYRVTEWWALTAMGRAGVSGSIDLGAAALIYSFTGNSNIRVPIARLDDALGGIQLHVTNQIGIAETADGVEIGDFELDYDLTNGVYRNGGYVTGAIGDSGWGWRLYGHDTRWSGDDLFVDAHAELGVALLSLADAAGFPYEALSLSAGYLGDFEDYEGVQFMVRGRF